MFRASKTLVMAWNWLTGAERKSSTGNEVRKHHVIKILLFRWLYYRNLATRLVSDRYDSQRSLSLMFELLYGASTHSSTRMWSG